MNCANHPQAPVAAYCRTCGKALCEECKRDVMGAIYCEPCIAARLQVGAPVGAGVAAGQVPPSGSPNLAVATILGMIPGVGAMYNGQFLKALIHVGIFASIVTVSEHVPGGDVFGFVGFFFWCYMVFDAYKTAQARQLGLPAPDLLGLHRLFGIQDAVTPAVSPAPPASSAPGSDASGASTSTSQATVPPATEQFRHGNQLPAGAVVLIALGVFFLLSNLGLLRMSQVWPLLLIGLGLWIAFKRTGGFDARRSNQ